MVEFRVGGLSGPCRGFGVLRLGRRCTEYAISCCHLRGSMRLSSVSGVSVCVCVCARGIMGLSK